MEIHVRDFLEEDCSTNPLLGELETLGMYRVRSECFEVNGTIAGHFKKPSLPVDVKGGFY